MTQTASISPLPSLARRIAAVLVSASLILPVDASIVIAHLPPGSRPAQATIEVIQEQAIPGRLIAGFRPHLDKLAAWFSRQGSLLQPVTGDLDYERVDRKDNGFSWETYRGPRSGWQRLMPGRGVWMAMTNVLQGVAASVRSWVQFGHPVGIREDDLTNANYRQKLSHIEIDIMRQGFGFASRTDPAYQRINDIVLRLLQAAGENPADYQFDIVMDDTPNAMVFQDVKHVLMTRGMLRALDKMPHLSEDNIAMITAHEIAHALLGSYWKWEQADNGSDRRRRIADDSGDTTWWSFPKAHVFGHTQEYRADELALKLMDEAGYNVQAAPEVIQLLLRLEQEDKLEEIRVRESRREEDDAPKTRFMLPSIFASHPPTFRRLTEMDRKIHDSPWAHENKAPVLLDKSIFKALFLPTLEDELLLGARLKQIRVRELAQTVRTSREIEILLSGHLPATIGYRRRAHVRISDMRSLHDVIRDSYGAAYAFDANDDDEVKKNIAYRRFNDHFVFDRVNQVDASAHASAFSRLRLYTSWDFTPEGLRETALLLKDKVYSRWIADYDSMAQRGVQKWIAENADIPAGLSRDIEVWLRFYSAYPSDEGLQRMHEILARLDSPADLSLVLNRMRPKPPTPEAFIELISDTESDHGVNTPRMQILLGRFVVAAANKLRQNGVLKSRTEELRYIKDLLQQDLEHPQAYERVDFISLRQFFVRQVGEIDTFDELMAWVDAVNQLPESALDQVRHGLVKDVILEKPFIRENADLALKFLVAYDPKPSYQRDGDILVLMSRKRYSPAFVRVASDFLYNLSFADEDYLFRERREQKEKLLEAVEAYEVKVLKRATHFEPYVSQMLKYGVYDYQRILGMAESKAISSTDVLRGLQIIQNQHPATGRSPKHKEFLLKLASIAYERGIHEGLGGTTFSQRISYVQGVLPPGLQRNTALTKTLKELGRSLDDFLSIRDLYLVDDSQKAVAEQWYDQYKIEFETAKERFDQERHRTRRSPLGRVRTIQQTPIQVKLSAGPLTQIKVDGSDFAFQWSHDYLSEQPFRERMHRLQAIYPEPSNERDQRIMDWVNQDQKLDLASASAAIALLHLPHHRLTVGRLAYENEVTNKAEHLEDFDQHLSMVLDLFPDFSIERDQYLSHVMNDAATVEAQVEKATRFLTVNNPASAQTSVLFAEAALESYRDLMQVANPRDKAEFILWMMDLRTKPDILYDLEVATGHRIDRVMASLDQSTPMERALFLQELLSGSDGIFTSPDHATERFFLDHLFVMLLPDRDGSTLLARQLKVLFDAVFERTGSYKKTRLVMQLISARTERGTLPQMIRMFLQAYGIIGVKGGQRYAARSSALSSPFRREMLKLTNDADPFAKPDVFSIARLTFNRPTEEVFRAIGKRRGSASVKQVHDVITAEGEEAVAKFLRPSIRTEIQGQLVALRHVWKTVQNHRELFGMDLPDSLVEEITRAINFELDFSREVDNQNRLRENIAGRWTKARQGFMLRVPRILEKYTRGSIITEEKMKGVPFVEADSSDRATVAKLVLDDFFDQVFSDGFFHADLNPGNILVDSINGVIGLIDAGSVGSLSEANRERLYDLILAVNNSDASKVKQWLVEMWLAMPIEKRKPLNASQLDQLSQEVIDVLTASSGESIGDGLYRVLSIIDREGIVLPNDYFELINALSTIDYLVKQVPDGGSYVMDQIKRRVIGRLFSFKRAEGRPTVQDMNAVLGGLSQQAHSVHTPVVKPGEPVATVYELWKTDFLPEDTRVRIPDRFGDEEVLLSHGVALEDGSTLRFKDNKHGVKGFKITPVTKNALHVLWEEQWQPLASLQISEGMKRPEGTHRSNAKGPEAKSEESRVAAVEDRVKNILIDAGIKPTDDQIFYIASELPRDNAIGNLRTLLREELGLRGDVLKDVLADLKLLAQQVNRNKSFGGSFIRHWVWAAFGPAAYFETYLLLFSGLKLHTVLQWSPVEMGLLSAGVFLAGHAAQLVLSPLNRGKPWSQRSSNVASLDVLLMAGITFVVASILPGLSPHHQVSAIHTATGVHATLNLLRVIPGTLALAVRVLLHRVHRQRILHRAA